MTRQRLLRALLIWTALVLIPAALVITGRFPRLAPWINTALSVVMLAGTLVVGVYVMRGKRER
ncbi:MAG TPA: hypothetical protein VJ672_01665 [Gemmatimonadaceae bacterium]|nr:hypothetical protein [Gemmatimonadaceae bacterium]